MGNLRDFLGGAPPDREALGALPVHERRVVEAALELRRMGGEHPLDLSRGSVDALDLIVDEALVGGFASPAHLLRSVACYFAALVVEHLGGQFVDLGPFPVFLRMPLPGDDMAYLYTSPLRLAIEAWEKRQPRFAEAFEGLAEMQEGLDRPVFVPFYDPGAIDPVFESVWLLGQSLQVILGRFEGGSWNLVMLPHNLRCVDAFLTRDPDAELLLRLSTLSDRPRELAWWRVRSCASFFGEMVREHLGGVWISPQRGPHEIRLGPDREAFSPVMLCQEGLDRQRGNYPLLMAYQQLMDYIASPQGDFPLAALRDETMQQAPKPPTGRLLTIVPDDEAPRAESTRPYDTGPLAQQMVEAAPMAGAEDEEEPALSTRQYNSDELQRQLIRELQRQSTSPQAYADTDELQATRDEPRDHDTSVGFEVDIDVEDVEDPNTGSWSSDELEDVGATQPTSDEDVAAIRRASQAPPGADPTITTDIPPALLAKLRAQGPKTGRMEAFNAATVQGEVPADLLARAHAAKTRPMGSVSAAMARMARPDAEPEGRTASADPTMATDIPPELLAKLRAQGPKTGRMEAFNAATVQGDISPELMAKLRATAAASASPSTTASSPPSSATLRPLAPAADAFDWSMEDVDVLPEAEAAETELAREARFAPRTEPLTQVVGPATPRGGEASTMAVDAMSDPRLRALMGAAPAPAPGPEGATMAVDVRGLVHASMHATDPSPPPPPSASPSGATRALPSTDPRLLALSRSEEAQAVVARPRRSTDDFQIPRPISSATIAARAEPSPHGALRDVHEQLRPVLVAADWPRLGEVSHRPLIVSSEAVPEVAIAIDYPDRLVYVNSDDLRAWDVSLKDIFQVACSNLARAQPRFTDNFFRLDLPDAEILQLEIGDFYEASRVFLPGLSFAAQELLGTDQLLVGIPNRNILLLSADRGEEAARQLQGVVLYCHSSRPHALSPFVFRYAEGEIADVVRLA